MVIRVATYGAADHEDGGEDVYGCHSSSAYFKQFHQSIKANTHVTAGVAQIALSDTMIDLGDHLPSFSTLDDDDAAAAADDDDDDDGSDDDDGV